MAKVQFFKTTQAAFTQLSPKNQNALYFVTDSKRLYKGDIPFSFPVVTVEGDFPVTGEAGVLYVKTDGSAKVWNGASYITLGSNMVDNFLASVERHVVTSEEAGSGIYAGMVENDIGILFTMQDNTKMFVKLTDLVDTYVADNSTAKGIAVTVNDYKISAEAKISATADNQLSLKDDGLFAAPVEWETV